MDEEKETVTIDGHRIELSRLDKVLFPADGITKGDLVHYYHRIAETALRHYRDRPLSMRRFPDGIESDGFFQKNMPGYFPDWIDRIRLEKEGGTVDYALASNAATLVYLADQACIEIHLALARSDRPHHPDRLVFDLDPADDDFKKVQRTAGHLKELLDHIEMPAFVQTTGSSGLHVIVPLDRSEDFEVVRDFSQRLTRHLTEQEPDLVTTEQRKKDRGDRVYLDVQRNAYGQTAIAPYAVRAIAGAPVATPLNWHEVADGDLGPQTYNIDNLFRRLAQIDDPWEGIARHACSIARARERLEQET